MQAVLNTITYHDTTGVYSKSVVSQDLVYGDCSDVYGVESTNCDVKFF